MGNKHPFASPFHGNLSARAVKKLKKTCYNSALFLVFIIAFCNPVFVSTSKLQCFCLYFLMFYRRPDVKEILVVCDDKSTLNCLHICIDVKTKRDEQLLFALTISYDDIRVWMLLPGTLNYS